MRQKKGAYAFLFFVALLFNLFAFLSMPGCSSEESDERNLRITLLFNGADMSDQYRDILEFGWATIDSRFPFETEFIDVSSGQYLSLKSEEDEDRYLLGVNDFYNAYPELMDSRVSDMEIVFIDSFPEDLNGMNRIVSESARYKVKVEDGAYTAGYIAGFLTRKTSIPGMNAGSYSGFIGEEGSSETERYFTSFERGFKDSAPEGLVYRYDHAGDPAVLAEQIQAMDKAQADIIFCTSESMLKSVLPLVENRGVYLIGAGTDMSSINPQKILFSVVKRTDRLIYEAVEAISEGSLKPGEHFYGIESEAIGISSFNEFEKYIDLELRREIGNLQTRISDGLVDTAE